MRGAYRVAMAVTLALSLAALVVSGCGGGSKKNSGATATAPTTTVARTTATAGSAGTTTAGSGLSTPTLAPAAVQTLPGGTIVANGTPITPGEATSIARAPTPTPGGTISTATIALAGAPTTLPGQTPVIESTPIPAKPPNPPPSGGNEPDTIRFASYTTISVSAGQPFDILLVAVNPSKPYQGYQWTLHMSANVAFVKSTPVEAAGLPECAPGTEVATRQIYGDCLKFGDRISTIYSGPLLTLTFQCTAPGAGNVKLLNVLEGTPFGTDFGAFDGSEYGGTSSDPVQVECS